VHDELRNVAEKDGRFRVEAFVFVFESLHRAQKLFEHERHVSGRELLEGFRRLATDRYGRLAKTVLGEWGLKTTDDVGQVVFLLVSNKLMSKTDEDRVEDFAGVFDFDEVFVRDYRMGDATKRGS